MQGGGPKAVERHTSKGKLLARLVHRNINLQLVGGLSMIVRQLWPFGPSPFTKQLFAGRE